MPKFTIVPVDSSNIDSVGHDEETNVLRVWFARGGIYDYENVPHSLFDRLVSADSVGGEFHASIKKQPGLYPYKKVA